MIKYSFIGYVLLCSVVLLISWFVYRLFLSRDLHPSKSRKIVLGLYPLMLIAPFISLPLQVSTINITSNPVVLKDVTIDFSGEIGVTDSESLYFSHLQEILLIVYLIGVILMTGLTLINILQLWRVSKRSEKTEINGTAVYLHSDRRYGSYTWFGKIFLRKNFTDMPFKEQNMILLHECAHVSHRHSRDLVVSQLVVIFQWFNPAAWLLQNELKSIHEYEADAAVINQGVNTKDYQNMLIDNGAMVSLIGMAVLFHNGALRERILMMRRNSFKERIFIRSILIVGLAFLTGCLVNIPAVASMVDSKNSLQIWKNRNLERNRINTNEYSERFRNYENFNDIQKIYRAVEVMPVYGGDISTEKIKSDLKRFVHYPENAIKKGIEGRVFLRFIVSEDGNLKDISIIRSVDSELDKEAVEAVKSLPEKWTPAIRDGKAVSCWFILPVNFKLPS